MLIVHFWSLYSLKSRFFQIPPDDLVEVDGMYSLDGSLFNLQYLQAHTMIQERLIRGLLFMDNAAISSNIEQALQCITFALQTLVPVCP